MNTQIELQPLIIKNLAVLEQAPAIADDIDLKIFSQIDSKVKNWVERKEGWDGIYDYINDELTFRDLKWGKDTEGFFDAYYNFSIDNDIDESNYFTSALVGVVKERCGIHFGVNLKAIKGLVGRKQTARWNSFLAERYAQSALRGNGFELNGSTLFLPIRIDAEELADAYPDALDDALNPIDEALDKVEAAHPEILALVQAAMTHAF